MKKTNNNDKIKKYVKKPIKIEAIQFNGWNHGEIYDWINDQIGVHPACYKETLEINTLEGTITAHVGDYILKGVNGEFYPCRSDIFEKTYDEI